MQTIDAAASYSAHSWRPIAIRANDKRPMAPGWQTAELTDTLAALNSTPGANIGVAVPPGFMVLDIDTKGGANGFDTLTNYPALPDTLTATTPTGGQHKWFKLPPGLPVPNRVGIAPGLDIRSAGGYVVAPPSAIDGKPYAWQGWDSITDPQIAAATPWLLQLIQQRPAPAPVAQDDDPIPDGCRNSTLASIAGRLRNAGLNAEEIAAALELVNERRCVPPLDDHELATIAQSVGRYPAPLEAWQVFGQAGELPAGVLAAPATKGARFNLLTPSDLSSLPPMRWLVRGVIPEAGLAAIYGPPGCGKSFLTLDLMGAIAEGRAWFSHNVSAAPCVYLALEGEAGVSQRMAAYMGKHGTPEGLRVILSPLDIRLADDRRELVAAIKGAGMAGGVLALDTLNRAAPGADENDSRAMGELIGAMKALQIELGGLVLAVHHSGKDQAKGLRGHSSLLAALDTVLEVTRQEGRREWRLAKAKDAGDDAAHAFDLDVVHLGHDADGEPITSCAIRPEGKAADTVRRAKIKIPAGGNQRVVWDALTDLLRFASVPDAPPEGLPPGRACIRLDEAIEKVRDRLPVESDRKTERTRQAITGLITRGILTLRDDFLWCP